jgi:DNA repair photolyase
MEVEPGPIDVFFAASSRYTAHKNIELDNQGAAMHEKETPIRGRGTAANPPNRFELLVHERDPCEPVEDAPAPATQFLRDATRSIISRNDSPDVGFDASINPYRGCEHGCSYCYARPTHEYLGFSAGLDFETKILVKENAPELLRRELSSRRWKPQVLSLSGVTDCYQPIERRLKITRRCLEVLAEFRNPVGIVTKNHLVARDVDLLGELARHDAAMVFLSLTSLDAKLLRKLEPRASHPEARLEAIRELTNAGIPTGVMVAPVIPALTDHEIPAILAAVAEAGGKCAGYTVLRLPFAVKSLFEQWLDQHFPERKDKVLGRIRETRGGKLNDARFGSRMKGEGAFAEMIREMFLLARRRVGIGAHPPKLSTASFRRPGEQPSLFD